MRSSPSSPRSRGCSTAASRWTSTDGCTGITGSRRRRSGAPRCLKDQHEEWAVGILRRVTHGRAGSGSPCMAWPTPPTRPFGSRSDAHGLVPLRTSTSATLPGEALCRTGMWDHAAPLSEPPLVSPGIHEPAYTSRYPSPGPPGSTCHRQLHMPPASPAPRRELSEHNALISAAAPACRRAASNARQTEVADPRTTRT